MFILLITGTFQIAHKFCPYANVCFGTLGMNKIIPHLLFPLTMIVGLLIALSSIFWGRIFCSHVCIFGTIQEMLFMTRNQKYRLTKRVPYYIDKNLMWVKYLVFIATLVAGIFSLSYLYMKFCPVMVISYPVQITIAGGITLIILLLGTFLTERLWCRYFCPYAAFMNVLQYIFGRIGIKRSMVYRNMEVCIDCGACNRNCPMNIEIKEKEYIKNPNCIQCRICVDKCPKKGALSECIECPYRKN
ncbi:MAG TPA: 4Fe-4S binding protein [Candidatus Cloacimonadota bacterium]|nr:4Fe-4S binding protein [Candidatus Cloacimonadota bacterium]